MKNKYLFERFPKLKEIKPLPIAFSFTAQLTLESENIEVPEILPLTRIVEVTLYQTKQLQQRAGHFKVISKTTKGIE